MLRLRLPFYTQLAFMPDHAGSGPLLASAQKLAFASILSGVAVLGLQVYKLILSAFCPVELTLDRMPSEQAACTCSRALSLVINTFCCNLSIVSANCACCILMIQEAVLFCESDMQNARLCVATPFSRACVLSVLAKLHIFGDLLLHHCRSDLH